MTTDQSPDDWARLLKLAWSERGESGSRDYFIASHAGWNDPAAWSRQAEADANFMLQGLGTRLADASVLEIGCGVGRLAPFIAGRARSYVGIDIARPMIAEAIKRNRGLPNVRFLESDGLVIPSEARDNPFDVILGWAVFIHCPRPVIASLLQSAWSCLAPGGEIRFQLRADPSDLSDMSAPPVVVAQVAEEQRRTEAASPTMDMRLVNERYYMGDQFCPSDVTPFLRQYAPGDIETVRPDPVHIYGRIRRST